MRTITQILVQGDASNDIDEIASLGNEIQSNLKKYTLVELKYAKEHLMMLAGKLGTKHAKEIKKRIGL